MKTANTAAAANTVTVTAVDTTWAFAPEHVTILGHAFDASYSVAKSGDVYVFASIDDTPVRIHVAQGTPVYHGCLEAAVAAKAAAQPAKQAEKPAAKAAAQPAKQAEKPAAKAAKQPAKQAEKPAVDVAAKAWIGTTITGKGFTIAFDEATQRTRVSFADQPTDKQRAAVEAAGFYWSPAMRSFNKRLTCKAYRAAVALADALNALA